MTSHTFDTAHIFRYHAPTPEKQAAYETIRDVARVLAETILDNAPPCADTSVALRHVREAVMNANAAIALDGRLHVVERAGVRALGDLNND